jgi:hypothetical protein
LRDLKHLAYFEDLLREANNALVRQARAERLPDGGIHCEGGLKSQFGNGALKAVIDLKPDGTFTGYVGLTKGLRLAIEGKRVA